MLFYIEFLFLRIFVNLPFIVVINYEFFFLYWTWFGMAPVCHKLVGVSWFMWYDLRSNYYCYFLNHCWFLFLLQIETNKFSVSFSLKEEFDGNHITRIPIYIWIFIVSFFLCVCVCCILNITQFTWRCFTNLKSTF